MLTLIGLLTASATTALASPLQTRQEMSIPSNWSWHVSGWEAGCNRSGCYYHFNVTIPTVPDSIAGVKAHCEGNENGWYRQGNWYENCQLLEGVQNGVSAKLGERDPDDGTGPKEVFISFQKAAYEFSDPPEPAYNFTGSHETIYNQFAAPLQEFDVTPTTVRTVA